MRLSIRVLVNDHQVLAAPYVTSAEDQPQQPAQASRPAPAPQAQRPAPQQAPQPAQSAHPSEDDAEYEKMFGGNFNQF